MGQAVVLTGARMSTWAQSSPAPRKYERLLLAGAWFVCFAFSVASDGIACTPAEPCDPVPAESVALALCFLSLVLLCWRLEAVAATATAFATFELVSYDVEVTALLWVSYAVLVISRVVRLRHLSARQSHLADTWAADSTAHVPFISTGDAPRDPRWPWCVAIVLGLAAAGCLVMYDRAREAEQVHVTRSQVVDSVVTKVTDDGDLRLVVSGSPGLRKRSVTRTLLESHSDGEVIPVRVDPEDPDWVVPVEEPTDHSWWLTLSAASAGLALAGGSAAWIARRRRRRLLLRCVPDRASPDAHAYLCRAVVSDDELHVLLLPADSDEVFARLWPARRETETESDEPRPCVLVGDLRAGGWVLPVVDGMPRAPGGPLWCRSSPPRLRDVLEPEPHSVFDSDELAAIPDTPLPMHAPPGRVRGVALAVLVLVCAFALMPPRWVEDGTIDSVKWLVTLSLGGWWATITSLSRTTVTRENVLATTTLRQWTVPLSAVDSVSWDGKEVDVAWEGGSASVQPPAGTHPRAVAATLTRLCGTPGSLDGATVRSRPHAMGITASIVVIALILSHGVRAFV